MIEAVVIDVDDTLCLTEAACFDMENETLRHMGRPAMGRTVHMVTWGKPLFQAILERSPGINVDDFRLAYDPIIKKYVESGRLDNIPEANLKALDQLVSMGKKLLILTSRELSEVAHMLKPDHHLAGRIARFYYKEIMQYHKPDPLAFVGLLDDNGLKPREAVYVGDSLTDAEATKRAGLHFIASLESGLRKREDFVAHVPDAFINTFPEVVSVIEELDVVV